MAASKLHKALIAPKPEEKGPITDVISHPERELASRVAKHAMIAGWERAIIVAAAEQNISAQRVEQILDEALKYNEKADPSGRIEELNDWKVQKRGVSNRMPTKGF